jgi:hypothetical protein
MEALMFKLEFKVNGRRVPANRVSAELAGAVGQSIQEEVFKRIRSARCSTHGRSPSNVHGWPNVRFDVCCDNLKAAVGRAIR